MNTDTKQNINTSIYIRTNADTSVNNHLHFHAGINSTPIQMGLLYTNNDIGIHSNASTSYNTHICYHMCRR